MTQRKALAFERSSGNVFADLGFEHPEEELAKAKLTSRLLHSSKPAALPKLLRRGCWDRRSQRLGPHRGQVAGFSTDRRTCS